MTGTVSVRSSHQRTKIWLFDLENIYIKLIWRISVFGSIHRSFPDFDIDTSQHRGEVDLEILGRKEDLRSLTSQAFRKGGPNPLGETTRMTG